MSKTIRIRTTPNGDDKFIKINMEQDFDFVEILSLKISQKELYTTFCAGYGAIVGRVSVNGGFGVPNAKVSVFIPVSELDRENDKIFGLYPFETISDLGPNGLRYNLLLKENQTSDDCFTPVGDFPDKRTFLDSDTMLDIYCEYYKFTTTTNAAGDYMLFGVPTGAQIMHAEADVSDIGVISQKPFDFVRKGASDESFESTTKFRGSEEDLDFNLQIIKQSPISVNVQPYWGDEDSCNVAITRRDIDFKAAITPHAIFMGSIFGDNEVSSLGLTCKPKEGTGVLNDQTAGTGRIEMVRKTLSGNIERFDVGGAQLIDSDGTWAYQVPMNLDYRVTDEYGNLVPTDDPKKGIPTRAKVRFRIKMDVTGGEGNLRERAAYLVPNNPLLVGGLNTDFEFGPNTREESLAELVWNGIYTVKNYIPRVQKSDVHPSSRSGDKVRTFLGIKDVDSARGKYTPYPYNHMTFENEALFAFICTLTIAFATLVTFLNLTVITPLNIIISILNDIINVLSFGLANDVIGYIACVTLTCNNQRYAPGCCSSEADNFPCDAPRVDLGCGAIQGAAVCVGQDGYGNEFNQTLPPGDAGYTKCIAISLAEDLNLFKFDFYNDWVNGSLYSPLFKVRIKDGDPNNTSYGPHKFCEWSNNNLPTNLAIDNDNDGQPDNGDFSDMYLVDTCFGIPQGCPNTTYPNCGELNLCNNQRPNNEGHRYIGQPYNIKHGLIVYYDNQYYYAPYSKSNDEYLLASDIVTLGSSVKCHWLGLPSVYELFVDTTYKLPPYLDEVENGVIQTSGMDNLSAQLSSDPCQTNLGPLTSLFFSMNCFFCRTTSLSCGNLRRQCELGVGFDELRGGTPPNDRLTSGDIDIRFTRNVFAWMNGYGLDETPLNAIYDSPFDINTDFNNEPACGNQVGGLDTQLNGLSYNRFRYGWVDVTGQGKMCDAFPQSLNSFYFYFGLNRNKTALAKMLSKYFAPCPVKDKPDFLIIGDTTDSTVICNNGFGNGEIDVTIQGGTAPYTYFWTYPDNTQFTITGNANPTLDAVDLEDLCGGAYVLTVVDANGLSSTITFIVGEPQPITCFTQSISTSEINASDGIINVFINGGLAPYTMDISPDPNALYPVSNLTVGQQIINGLPAGQYTITVTDSNGELSTCVADVTDPQGLNFLLNHVYVIGNVINPNDPEDPNSYVLGENTFISNNNLITELDCANSTNGIINIDILTGVPPYTITVIRNNDNTQMLPSPFNPYLFPNLVPSVYTVEVEDNTGYVSTQNISIISGQLLQILNTPPYNIGIIDDSGSGDGQIIFYVVPSTIGDIMYWQLLDVNTGDVLNAGSQTISANPEIINITGVTAGSYYIKARNGNNCETTEIFVTVPLA
jgi:hypothetical protein